MNLFPFQFHFRMKHNLAVQQPKLKRVPTKGWVAGWTTPLLNMRAWSGRLDYTLPTWRQLTFRIWRSLFLKGRCHFIKSSQMFQNVETSCGRKSQLITWKIYSKLVVDVVGRAKAKFVTLIWSFFTRQREQLNNHRKFKVFRFALPSQTKNFRFEMTSFIPTPRKWSFSWCQFYYGKDIVNPSPGLLRFQTILQTISPRVQF